MPLVYNELRQMARCYMSRQPSVETFQTTELIHEAYLKLAGRDRQNFQNRAHFFGVAAKAIGVFRGRGCCANWQTQNEC